MSSELTAECAGCGAEVPYRVGAAKTEEGTCYGETLKAYLGRTFIRTCWDRECVLAARVKMGAPGPPAKRFIPKAEGGELAT